MKQRKPSIRIFALTVCIAMLFGMATLFPVSAEEWGDPDGDGVYEIYTADDLFAFAAACSDSSMSYFDGKTVRLMCDIDVNPGWEALTKTVPARTWTRIDTFKGCLDGQGYTISGLYITGNGNQGFIWRGNGCTVKNLNITNSYIYSTNSYNAGVVASVTQNKCTFENILSDVIIEAPYSSSSWYFCSGGIVGALYGAEADFTDCVFTGSIETGGIVGGILGTNNSYRVSFDGCVNYGKITTLRSTGKGVEAGGIIGRISSAAELSNCVNFGDIVSGNSQWDGALGYLDRLYLNGEKPTDVADVIVRDCYVLGGATLSNGLGMHGTRKYYNITVSYNGTDTVVLTSADGSTQYSGIKDKIETVADISGFLSVTGTDASVFRYPAKVDGNTKTVCISTVRQLVGLEQFYKAFGKYEGWTVLLENDIDLNPGWDASSKEAPAIVWTPVTEFRGTFNGNGHSVSGIYVNRSTEGSAFIVKAVNATVENFAILNSYILSTSKDYIGSVCSSANNSLIRNIYSEAIVEGRKDDGTAVGIIGGIVGGLYNAKATVGGCVFAGRLIGGAGIGGIVGVINSVNSALTIYDCANYGTVESSSNHNGGIVGIGRGNIDMDRCVNAGKITASDVYSGGIAYFECNTSKAEMTLTDCYYKTGTFTYGITSYHNYYSLSVTYGDGEAQLYNADSNTKKGTNHNTMTAEISGTEKLLEKKEYASWYALGDIVMPADVAQMRITVPAHTEYVQESLLNDGPVVSVRFISLVELTEAELENYDEIGFTVIIVDQDGKQAVTSVSGSNVYESILANEEGGLTRYTAADLGGNYIGALTLSNIPVTGTFNIYVRAFITHTDSTTTFDCARMYTVTGGNVS